MGTTKCRYAHKAALRNWRKGNLIGIIKYLNNIHKDKDDILTILERTLVMDATRPLMRIIDNWQHTHKKIN